MLIITSFLLSMSGCGYKAAPYYEKEAPQGDSHVEFYNEKKNFDNNESCE